MKTLSSKKVDNVGTLVKTPKFGIIGIFVLFLIQIICQQLSIKQTMMQI